jgi:GNAT superfamily N-acetyltransferase
MVSSPASVLLVARDAEGAVIGSLTLALFRVPTGLRAWIEDVVVDESARGAGAGEALVLEAVRRARGAGARSIDLTSRPSREAGGEVDRARPGPAARRPTVSICDWASRPGPPTCTAWPSSGPTPVRPMGTVPRAPGRSGRPLVTCSCHSWTADPRR